MFGQFFFAHIWHGVIGEQQINVSNVSRLLQAQGFDAVGCHNRVTQSS
jgi:hypothetical protein